MAHWNHSRRCTVSTTSFSLETMARHRMPLAWGHHKFLRSFYYTRVELRGMAPQSVALWATSFACMNGLYSGFMFQARMETRNITISFRFVSQVYILYIESPKEEPQMLWSCNRIETIPPTVFRLQKRHPAAPIRRCFIGLHRCQLLTYPCHNVGPATMLLNAPLTTDFDTSMSRSYYHENPTFNIS